MLEIWTSDPVPVKVLEMEEQRKVGSRCNALRPPRLTTFLARSLFFVYQDSLQYGR
jgi:hypothetical protein